jgi:hypothetical protein
MANVAGRSKTNWFNNQGLVFAVSNAMSQVRTSSFVVCKPVHLPVVLSAQ